MSSPSASLASAVCYPSTPPECLTAICHACSHNPDLQSIDAAKINKLLTVLTDRLSTDIHGNIYVEGSKIGTDTRLGQLREVISLKNTLEQHNMLIERSFAIRTPKESTEPEKPLTMNKATKDAIAAIVEDKTQNRFHDIAIHRQRHEERIQSLETAQKLSKPKPKPVTAVSKYDVLQKSLNQSEAGRARLVEDLKAVSLKLEDTKQSLVQLERKLANHVASGVSKHNEIGHRVACMESTNNALTITVGGLEVEHGTHKSNLDNLTVWTTSTSSDINALFQSRDNATARIGRLESRAFVAPVAQSYSVATLSPLPPTQATPSIPSMPSMPSMYYPPR